MVKDIEFGKTCAHDLALSGILPFHTDAWHAVRLQSLKKRGADLRTCRDLYGRTPILIALEEFNVAFLRAILKVELGEEWGMRIFRKMPPYKENGRLMKTTLQIQQLVKQTMPVKLAEFKQKREELEFLMKKSPLFAENAGLGSGELNNDTGDGAGNNAATTGASPLDSNKDRKKTRRGTVALPSAGGLLGGTSPVVEKRTDAQQLYLDELRVYMLELMPKLFPRSITLGGSSSLLTFGPLHRAILESDTESILC
ncbi:unnamed protein product, partial [Amoebophrya sp. A120]|eukprot:GSA120T00013956001.1